MKAYCINLEERPEKWEATQAAFEGSGITLERFPGVKHSEGWKGCGYAHQGVVREALRAGRPWVLIVEDDCVLRDDFAARWPTVRDALWTERGAWDVFLGGPTYIEGPVEDCGEHLLKISQGFALHFYVIQAAAYERVLAWRPERHGPIDVYYSAQFRLVTTRPPLARQRAGLSDIKGEAANYAAIFNAAEDQLERLVYAGHARWTALAAVTMGAVVAWVVWRRK